MTDPDRAAEGRALLEGWKRQHASTRHPNAGPWCNQCDDRWPCRTARLVAALEEALEQVSEILQESEYGTAAVNASQARILGKLTEEAR